jgi:uncharacterized protein with PQ loop repeat
MRCDSPAGARGYRAGMDGADLLGWAGTLLFLARLLPQPLKLRRTGHTEGVSPQALLNGEVSALGWVVHGLSVGLVPVWVAAVAAIPIDLWTLHHLRAHVELRHAAGACAWAAVLVAARVLFGPIGLGLVLGGSVVVNHVPQVWKAMRAPDLSGLSAGTWWIGLADAGLWGAYGLFTGDAALITYGVVLTTASVTILTAMRVKAPGPARPADA